MPEPLPEPQNLHEAITQGIQSALRDLGVDLVGCPPDNLSGHVIGELKRMPGWHSPARAITDHAELDALPVDSVVIEVGDGGDGEPRAIVWQRDIRDDEALCWASPHRSGWRYSDEIDLPVRVLWTPRDTKGEISR